MNIENLMLVTAAFSKDCKTYGVDTIISGKGDDSSFGGSMRQFAEGLTLEKFNQLAGLPKGHVHYGACLLFFADSPFLYMHSSDTGLYPW